LSKIKTEIERFMDGPTDAGSTVTSSFMFPTEFIGFQGQASLKQRVVLKEVLLAKFIAPVLPGDRITCTVSGAAESDTGFGIYKARFTKGADKVADLKLRVSLGDAP
jgi:3-hydroxymyristoyl/3-hydroxydecanoyl-(acyl carrier protein) dehydratase